MINYKEQNVFEEALDRIRYIFDHHDGVMVCFSGGKDSTVLFNLAMMIAEEKNRLPLRVLFLDQEVEWLATIEQVETIMTDPRVKPYWYQIPFDFTNSLSHQNNFLRIWDETKESEWIRPKHPMSIKENPTDKNRFHDIIKALPYVIAKEEGIKEFAVLVGIRISESLNRRTMIMNPTSNKKWHGISWCANDKNGVRNFYPIYDFYDSDIWTAIAKNKWPYNRIYNLQYQYGMGRSDMRVSALIHETAWMNVQKLQEFEPNNYNKFVKRINGTSTFSHLEGKDDIIIKKLPFMFKDWKEYRDYLLENLVKSEYHEKFRRKWKNQDEEKYYRWHVKEILVNDIDGTKNSNTLSKLKTIDKNKENVYYNKAYKEYKEYMRGKEKKDND